MRLDYGAVGERPDTADAHGLDCIATRISERSPRPEQSDRRTRSNIRRYYQVSELCPRSGDRIRSQDGHNDCKILAARNGLDLTAVLAVFSGDERIRITLLPARPSRLNAISIPNARRNICMRDASGRRGRGDFSANRCRPSGYDHCCVQR